ncbi:MAG: TonB-dependent receptor plug domain-containing protein, partial [Chitinophagaceae bacterium]|nr:TonB-dependent receptor plug domain-containing protein [Chitinophagaceae bacterium]
MIRKRTPLLLFSTIVVLSITLFTSLPLQAQEINAKLRGSVTDTVSNAPLSGATVHINGTTHRVETNNKGQFAFVTGQLLPIELTITYIGYETKSITVTTADPLVISLKEAAAQLNDVVVVGYATQDRRNLTGSVSKIDPSTTKTIPEASFDAQLQGKAAGVQIASNTGVPGSDVFIRVRGATSINASNNPLYVIDGVFVNNGSLQNIAQDRGTSPLSDINPNDIQSIEILKDAVAIAIYGSRGANGVIIITTKRGSYGQKAKVELSASEGFAKAPEDRVWETTTGPEHAILVNEFRRNMAN